MMKQFLNWLKSTFSPRKEQASHGLRQTGTHLHKNFSHGNGVASKSKHAESGSQPEYVDMDPRTKGHAENNDPDKKAAVRSKYVREETGTHDTLTIIDESLVDADDEAGLDPYNTGQFDRSKNWDSRFRK
jgi:hypothetical protein